MKAFEELTAKEILQMINKIDKAMFAQPIEKQGEYAKAIGKLINRHQVLIKGEAA